VAFTGRHDANGIAVERFTVRAAPDAPIAVAIDGAGIVPLHWAGGSDLQTLAAGELALEVRLARASATAPFAFAGSLGLAAGATSLRDLVMQFGPGRVVGSAQIAFGLADWRAGRDPRELAGEIALDVEELDLQQLPPAWFAPLALQGRAAAQLRASGAWRESAPELRVTIADGALRDGAGPLLEAVQLRVVFAADRAVERTLQSRLDLSAQVPANGDLRRLGLGPELTFAATVRCTDRGTVLEPTVLRLGDGELALELQSDLRRADLLAGRVAAATTIDGSIGLRAFVLERLPPGLLPFRDCKGRVDGTIRIGGTIGNAGLEWLRGGTLSLRDGELKVDDMPRFEQVTARLDADERVVLLQSLTGVLGAGRFTAHGSLRQPRSLVADPFAQAAIDLQLVGDDLLLFRGDGARVRASVRADATGTPEQLRLGGEVVLGRGSKYVRRISILPDLNRRGGKAADDGLRLPALPTGLGDRLQLDFAVRTEEPFEVRANVFEGDLEVAARLRGSGAAPRLEGTMATRNGLFRFPGANLRLTAGLLTFHADEPRFPMLAVQAEGKRMGITVTMSVTGRYDRPEVQLSSVPPLPPQDLIVLLTTGQLPATLAAQGAAGQARFVGSYLAKEVFESYLGSDSTERGAGMFDRLTIEAGREVSRNGTESVLIEYELLPKLAVQAERDAFEDYNLGLVLRFRFR
jgi:TamB, inner membrane protein subunit of TAM complex